MRPTLSAALLLFCFCAVPLAPLAACGSSDSSSSPTDSTPDAAQTSDASPPPDGSPADGATTDAPSSDAPSTCPRTPAAADRARKVVVSHPFGATTGQKATAFEVLDLAADGTLSRPATPVTFQMGTALEAPIVFTPDGQIGMVAQDDGSIGVFSLSATGAPTVIHAAFKADFYASGIVMDPTGTHAWVLDSNTASNKGGVYDVAIGCDGTLTSRGLAVTTAPAHAMALLPTDPNKALLASSGDLFLVDLVAKSSISNAKPFGDNDAIPSSVAIAPDGKFAVIADDGILVGSRLGVVSVGPGGGLASGPTIATPYPTAVAFSPYDNAAVVLNDDSTDQIHILSYDPTSATAPVAMKGELAYKFGKPLIPATVMVLDRGTLKGRAFVSENTAVRELTFTSAGDVEDTQKLDFGAGNTSIVGVVGVEP